MPKVFQIDFYRRQGQKIRWFGLKNNFIRWLHLLVNKVIYFECLQIIVLEREDARLPDGVDPNRFSSRFADYEDLLEMRRQGTWQISDTSLHDFGEGDRCLLSYVDGRLAGYTWVHTKGRPLLIPGLRIRVPAQYLYNFAGFTLPEYRGLRLQGYRHHLLLSCEEWSDRRGLLGYVKTTNWSSRKGQSKSGYRTIGSLWLVGRQNKFHVFVSKALRDFGVERLSAQPALRSSRGAKVAP
jgi:GNAT superfamily N-acetyltransferase